MDPGFVKEEFAIMEVLRPMEGLHDIGPPPFLTKTYDLVDDESTNDIVSWSLGNNSFVVWDLQGFSMNLLPRYFKHNNFSSFVRQLNTYGFRKVDPDRWEFANEGFLRGQKHLLRSIRRKTHSHPHAGTEVARFGLDAKMDQLRHDKQALMAELVKLRQQQRDTRAYLEEMEERLSGMETKQRRIMGFLARAMQNLSFVGRLSEQDGKKELQDAIQKKRRRPIDQGPSNIVKVEHHEYGDIDITRFSDLELERLAGEIQGLSGFSRDLLGEERREESGAKELDRVFWEDLLNAGERELGLSQGVGEGEREEGMEVLTEQPVILGSSSKLQ
ncbi:hypothetical protein NMG60_11032097 [Bertholletia excelsa]